MSLLAVCSVLPHIWAYLSKVYVASYAQGIENKIAAYARRVCIYVCMDECLVFALAVFYAWNDT